MTTVRKKYKLVTVQWPQYFTYCTRCSGVWIDMRETCDCTGKEHKTVVNHRILKYKGVPEPIAQFMVRFQGGKITSNDKQAYLFMG